MKKLTIIAMTLLMATSAFAQTRNSGDLVLRDGRTTVRINVGSDRDERDQLMRIRRLEQAVRDLQDQVYQLQSTPSRREIVVCSATFFSAGSMTSRGNTELEARADLKRQCERRTSAMFCNDSDIQCERSYQ